MAVTLNAKGTTEHIFTLGKQGPKLKNSSGVLELRNSTDTGFINFQSLGIDDNASANVITIDVDENVQMYRDQADATEVLTLIQDNAGASGDVIAIGNDGTGDGIEIISTGESRSIFITSASTTTNSLEIENQFAVGSIASPVNYIKIDAATTSNGPTLSAIGSDTNIDLNLSGKGTGSVNFGDASGSGDSSVTTSNATTSSGDDGANLLIQTGVGDGVGAGGDITLFAGTGGATGDGGNIILAPGAKGAGGTNNGYVDVQGKLKLPVYTVATIPSGVAGDTVYVSNGDAGSPSLAVHNGTDWKVVAFGATISST